MLRSFSLTLLCLVLFSGAWAQEAGEFRGEIIIDPLPEVDTTLFRLPSSIGVDTYADATRYYRVQSSTQRRGLYYMTFDRLFAPSQNTRETLFEPENSNRVSLYTTDRSYRVGGSAAYDRSYSNGWSLRSGVNFQSGRDCLVEGVFRNRFSLDATINKRFSHDHFLTIDLSFDYLLRGMQSNATQESYSLTGNNYYNPVWGFYHGKVRNARVNRSLNPTLEAHYQRRVGSSTHLITDLNSDISTYKRGSLGWYDAQNPYPDYYRKMPSFVPDGFVKDYVTDIWRTNNTDYTQINWDNLEQQNLISEDKSAHYAVEDRVERAQNIGGSLLFCSELKPRLQLIYGVKANLKESRNYKSMRDLLGADFLLDIDQFMGDSYNASLGLQNNLLNPNNQVGIGDKFGYDYSIFAQSTEAVARVKYRSKKLDFDIEVEVGKSSIWRKGHFEKERFAGSASLGNSQIINFSPYKMNANVGYALSSNHYVELKGMVANITPRERALFLNSEAANFIANDIKNELIRSLSLNYHYTTFRLDLSGEAYILSSRGGGWVTPFYDDLSSKMTRAVISNIGVLSFGAEIVADLNFYPDWSIQTALSIGSYEYDRNAEVALYDDFDLKEIAESTPSLTKGVKIGNAPQVALSSTLSYFGFKNYILRLSGSVAGGRYVAPSIIRRSERVVRYAELSDNVDDFLTQEKLDDIVDFEISSMRYFWINNHSLSVKVAIRNLLGDRSRIYYARESDRLLRYAVDGIYMGGSPRGNTYQYGAPRSLLISVGYKF